MFKFLRSITKFWLYLSAFYIISKKPLNVRMGKGKGSRKGLVCLVKSGNSIIELKYCRLGLLLKLCKYIGIRCSFKTHFIFSNFKSISRMGLNVINYSIKLKPTLGIKNKRYIKNRLLEVYDQYNKSSNIKRYKNVKKHYRRYFGKKFTFRFRRIYISKYHRFLKKFFKKKRKYCYTLKKIYKRNRRTWRIAIKKKKKNNRKLRTQFPYLFIKKFKYKFTNIYKIKKSLYRFRAFKFCNIINIKSKFLFFKNIFQSYKFYRSLSIKIPFTRISIIKKKYVFIWLFI